VPSPELPGLLLELLSGGGSSMVGLIRVALETGGPTAQGPTRRSTCPHLGDCLGSQGDIPCQELPTPKARLATTASRSRGLITRN